MKETILQFGHQSMAEAILNLFNELNIPVYEINIAGTLGDFLGDGIQVKESDQVGKVTLVGSVDDKVFAKRDSDFDYRKVMNEKQKYDGLIILGVELKKENPTRTFLSNIARALNRSFHSSPVVIIFKYSSHISLANAERIQYKQRWREGEKVGKISLLKDVSIDEPHRGHLEILKELRITKKSRVNSFSELYYFWQSVFSISVLNKSFYEKVITWFNWAVREIKIPGQKPESEKHKDFAVRLIARLIFIWFLKELKVVKEDLLIPEYYNGDKNQFIIPKEKSSAYYKFILQNLFFNSLNRELTNRKNKLYDHYSDSFENSERLKELIFFSPYLNGGLFEQHPNDWCDEKYINNAFEVPDELFLKSGKGLNSILSRYKFTIVENTPLEEEIAVDPEMLGRIFENLLAEQTDDTKDAARKNTGAFYTPRPVVSYMCRKTLLRYLNTDIKPENGKEIIHKLLNMTILDPACGSGAFPMGMLEEMMHILEKVDSDGNLWVSEMLKSKDQDFLAHISEFVADQQIRYVKKLGLLRNCLFGVDILEYAVEITRLRCWLSLIVEQKVDFKKPNYNLKPLPNLEFKFYKKNSLYRKYEHHNLNDLVVQVDKQNLLKDLVDLENQYFIANNDRQESKEEIKQKIVHLLEKAVDSQYENIQKSLNGVRTDINKMKNSGASKSDINRLKKKEKKLAEKLGELAGLRDSVKDYFIERVIFPGIFSKDKDNPGFDIVIGNPPYVNTKLISNMGQTQKLKDEYGYCDDLYNHFIIRGNELLRNGGLLCYITSDTFLTLQTKKNIRMEFLGIPKQAKNGNGLFENEESSIPNCRLLEVVNTPKAFAALVDTAIFTVKKEKAGNGSSIIYTDLRKPSAKIFDIPEKEWQQMNMSKDNIAGWERVLDRTFTALGYELPQWEISHTCDKENVYSDAGTTLPKYKLGLSPYRQAINFAIFAPSPYNCQILDKIVKPARPIFDIWWDKIETSKKIENNRTSIKRFLKYLSPGDITLLGLMTDGGQGLATGNNGRFVGYKEGTRYAQSCSAKRPEKLWDVIKKNPALKTEYPELAYCTNQKDVTELLINLEEKEIWNLFDEIKEKHGLRVFGKGFLYRVIPDNYIFNVNNITENQKTNGIEGERCYVPYDKGDKGGNRWYSETPYFIDWSKEAVKILSTDSRARWQGYQFFFRNGFCWSDVLNPNSQYIKSRLKGKTVNDVKSMSLYNEAGLGDEYFVTTINSYLVFKLLREFFNSTVAIQINDLRKIPIKIPTKQELEAFNKIFNQCLDVKLKYFNQEIDRVASKELLKPFEKEVDDAINRFYGIDVHEEVEEEELDEEVDEMEFKEDDD